ncbi:PAS domain S-box protein [Candidatus Methanomassiliicoccus intestinalis]|uniref:PAS domain S-box protein n=1 Tax=Candidatus Methanomassiliicoccus intestinalis TaxID=1406512 RepID=UPI0037DD60E0
MFDSEIVQDLLNNLPAPCMYFDDEEACRVKNKLSHDFLTKWEVDCTCLQDVSETFNIPLQGSGRTVTWCGCIEYAFVPIKKGSIFIFNQNQTLAEIKQLLPMGLLIVDRHGRVVEFNSRLRELLGYAPADLKALSALKGRWTDNGLKLSTGEWAPARSLKNKEVIISDCVDVVRKNGTRTTLCFSACPLCDSYGAVMGAVSFVQDLAQQRAAELDAVEGKRKAEECLKELVKNIQEICTQDNDLRRTLTQVQMTAENTYKGYQIENRFFSSELMDISYLIDSAGCECERSITNGTIVLCEVEGHKLVSANVHLREAFKTVIQILAENSTDNSEITIKIKDYCEQGKEYHRIEIKENLDDEDNSHNELVECRNRADCHLSLVEQIIRNFGGRIWAEEKAGVLPGSYSRFVILLPAAVCTEQQGLRMDMESFA